MYSLDMSVLQRAQAWLQVSQQVWLATVVRTWGSAPRPVGSMMAVRDDGQIVGSVSGGCVEDHLVGQLLKGELHPVLPVTLRYGANGDEARRFDLPCGATLAIVLERLSSASGLVEVLDAVDRHQVVTRRLDLISGAVTVSPAGELAGLRVEDDVMSTEFGPRHRLLLIGAGEVSRYVAQMALALDYRVALCDPREGYRGAWDVSKVELSREMPDDWICAQSVDSNTAIVALSHDPKLDDMALLEALVSPAFYVGAIGSRRNTQARKARLMKYFDLSEIQVDRLHGPVGLSIGASTPPEIAVSILAEITAVRRGVAVTKGKDRLAALSETDAEVDGNVACIRS